MFLELATCLVLGVAQSGLLLFNYVALGSVYDAPTSKSIFSYLTYLLAKRRLSKDEITELQSIYSDKSDYRRGVIAAGSKHFFFEKILGYCPVCASPYLTAITTYVFYSQIELRLHYAIVFVLILGFTNFQLNKK